MSMPLFCFVISLVFAVEDLNREFNLNVNGAPSQPINWVTRGCVTPVNNQGQCGMLTALFCEILCLLSHFYLYSLSYVLFIDSISALTRSC
jgi:hypothetical protein